MHTAAARSSAPPPVGRVPLAPTADGSQRGGGGMYPYGAPCFFHVLIPSKGAWIPVCCPRFKCHKIATQSTTHRLFCFWPRRVSCFLAHSTFVVAMKACGDAGRWKEALALMDDMRRDGTPPMETTYTTAVSRARSQRRCDFLSTCCCTRWLFFIVSFRFVDNFLRVGLCYCDDPFTLVSTPTRFNVVPHKKRDAIDRWRGTSLTAAQ